MTISFRPYEEPDFESCLRIFDENCPAFFAPNERADYSAFLHHVSESYQVCVIQDRVCGAFGVLDDDSEKRLNWIMIDPGFHGQGIGSAIMNRAISIARQSHAQRILIAASDKSSPFFAKFGATIVSTTQDGWGPGMHRVDMQLVVEN